MNIVAEKIQLSNTKMNFLNIDYYAMIIQLLERCSSGDELGIKKVIK